MDFEVEGVKPRGSPKKTWSEVTEKDCETRQICKENAMDHRKWRKLSKATASIMCLTNCIKSGKV